MDSSFENIEAALTKGNLRRAEQLLDRVDIEERGEYRYVMLNARLAHLTHEQTKYITLLEALPVEAQQPDVLILLGDAYFSRYTQAPIGHSRRMDADHALRHYHNCIVLYPHYQDVAWVYYKIGVVLKALNEQESACSYFRQSLNMPSEEQSVKSFAYEQLAHYEFYIQRDFKQAYHLQDLAIAVYKANTNPVWYIHALLFKAKILQVQHRPQEAIACVESAVKQAKATINGEAVQLADIYFNAGEIIAQIDGMSGQSANYMQAYLQLRTKPEGIDISWSRANEIVASAYFAEARYKEALEAYIATLEYNPYHPWQTTIHYQIARCYYHEGNYQQAIHTLQQLLDTAQRDNITVTDFRVYDMLGGAYFAIGDFKAAAHAYREALKLTPPHPDLVDKIRLYWHYSQQLDQQKDNPK